MCPRDLWVATPPRWWSPSSPATGRWRPQIADGSLRGFSANDELLDYLQRSHRRSA